LRLRNPHRFNIILRSRLSLKKIMTALDICQSLYWPIGNSVPTYLVPEHAIGERLSVLMRAWRHNGFPARKAYGFAATMPIPTGRRRRA
jgi:hypothetical protein